MIRFLPDGKDVPYGIDQRLAKRKTKVVRDRKTREGVEATYELEVTIVSSRENDLLCEGHSNLWYEE